MTPKVDEAMMAVQDSLKARGVESWFLAVRDPDSTDRQCRIHGDMEAGFGLAHSALAGQANPLTALNLVGINVHAMVEDLGVLEKSGIQTWFLAFRAGADRDIFYACQGNTEQAFGLGVACLHIMIWGHLGLHPVVYSALPQKPPPADGGEGGPKPV